MTWRDDRCTAVDDAVRCQLVYHDDDRHCAMIFSDVSGVSPVETADAAG
jgi:hypothetical protein